MTIRGRGALLDTPGISAAAKHRPLSAHLELVGDAPPPPRALGLRSRVPFGRDQGATSTCVGHGLTTAIATYLGQPPASAVWAWLAAKAAAGMDMADPESGAMISAAWLGARTLGELAESSLPLALGPDGAPVDPSILLALPPVGVLEGLGVELDSFRLDEAQGADLVLVAKRSLAAGTPFTLGLQVGDAFQAYQPGQTWAGNDANTGGHCVCAVGYDDAASLIVCNSWSSSWGGVRDSAGDWWPGCFRLAWSVLSSGQASDLVGPLGGAS